MSGNDLIVRFFSENDTKGLGVIKNIFLKILRNQTYGAVLNYYEEEDLFQEFLATKILPNKERILEIFYNQNNGLVSYIQRMAKNFLTDFYISTKKMSENEISEVFNNKEDHEDGKMRSYFDLIGKKEDHTLSIEVEEIEDTLMKNLTSNEWLIFCYQISDKKEVYKTKHLTELKDDALYKRIERMKKRLREIAIEYSFSKEAFERFLQEKAQEICKRFEVNENG
jgi:hypothetical protein